jgi:hypothetical protein
MMGVRVLMDVVVCLIAVDGPVDLDRRMTDAEP